MMPETPAALALRRKRKPATRLLSILFLLFVGAGCKTERPRAPHGRLESSGLTTEQAMEIVRRLAPDGKIKSVHLVRKGGHLVWKAKIVQPALHEIVKIWINPKTGEPIAVRREKQK